MKMKMMIIVNILLVMMQDPLTKKKNNKKDEMSSEKLSELTVAKLRDILKSYNLSTSGSKSLLISRIMEHQENSKSEKK